MCIRSEIQYIHKCVMLCRFITVAGIEICDDTECKV